MKAGWRGFLALLTLNLAVWAAPAHAEKAIPAPPRYYVLDEPGVLDKRSLRALQSLLVEHDRLTSEQFVIAIMNSLGDEDPVEFTSRVFQQWKIGRRGKDNGVLLALYWNDHKARIEVGYGLEPLLTDAKAKDVISTYLVPELKAGNPNRALALSSLEILKVLESPLIQSGKAQEILKSGGFRGSWRPARSTGPGPWQVWIIVGIIFAIIVFNMLSSAEAHYTSAGWYRPNPWRGRRAFGGWGGWGGGWGSGGSSSGDWGSVGGGGGGGVFSGGGGSSGGGGASGSW